MSINSPPNNNFYGPFKFFRDFRLEIQDLLKIIQSSRSCPTDEFLPKEDLLKKFKISRGMYTNLKRNGIIKDYRLGGKHYIKKSELLATLENNKS